MTEIKQTMFEANEARTPNTDNTTESIELSTTEMVIATSETIQATESPTVSGYRPIETSSEVTNILNPGNIIQQVLFWLE